MNFIIWRKDKNFKVYVKNKGVADAFIFVRKGNVVVQSSSAQYTAAITDKLRREKIPVAGKVSFDGLAKAFLASSLEVRFTGDYAGWKQVKEPEPYNDELNIKELDRSENPLPSKEMEDLIFTKRHYSWAKDMTVLVDPKVSDTVADLLKSAVTTKDFGLTCGSIEISSATAAGTLLVERYTLAEVEKHALSGELYSQAETFFDSMSAAREKGDRCEGVWFIEVDGAKVNHIYSGCVNVHRTNQLLAYLNEVIGIKVVSTLNLKHSLHLALTFAKAFFDREIGCDKENIRSHAERTKDQIKRLTTSGNALNISNDEMLQTLRLIQDAHLSIAMAGAMTEQQLAAALNVGPGDADRIYQQLHSEGGKICGC